MASCRQGHPVSAESGFCEICGDDVRPRCSQGHRSGVGGRFCETCGEPLLAGQAHAADEYVELAELEAARDAYAHVLR